MKQLNIFGKLELCCSNPLTGAYRDGYCNTGVNDIGTHTVCAIVTNEFLNFRKVRNDLTIDNPMYNFKGLKEETSGVCAFQDGLKHMKLDVLLI